MLPMVLAGLAFLWSDEGVLSALDVLALLTASSLLMLRAQGGYLQFSSLVDYALGSTIAVIPAPAMTRAVSRAKTSELRRAS